MASPPLILWPQEDSPSPPTIASRPKARRTSKSTSTSKKIPQRGLGVAQLEHILNLPASVYGAPVAYAGSGAQICYVPQFCEGYRPVSAIRSLLHEHYSMDRHRARSVAAAAGELPSNQRVCVSSSDLWQFCSRKKRVLSEDIGLDGGGDVLNHYFGAVDENFHAMLERGNHGCIERRGSIFAKEREIKEYNFFPHNPMKESNAGDLVFDKQTAGGSSSSSGGAVDNVVDLSLKLY